MIDYHFDLFVIGAGSGGVRAARLAAASGASVGMAEEFRFGGTCVIRGCVPKKLMVNAADFKENFTDSESFGWSLDKFSFNWRKFVEAKDKEISRLETIYKSNLIKSGVKLFEQKAVFLDRETISLQDKKKIRANHILIATGGYPFVPEILGSNSIITSNEVFDLKDLPSKILIVGGGYIACEFAGIFNNLGSRVVQVYRGSKIMRGFDSEVRDHLSLAMVKRGIDLRVNTDVNELKNSNGKSSVVFSDNNEEDFDKVLYATGRLPNSRNLGLEKVGVKVNKFGAVMVNAFQETNVPSIYAIGDVTNRLNLTPVAIRDAMAFHETVFKGKPTKPDHELVPTAVFSRPEVGTVGWTEEESRERCAVVIYRTLFRPMANIISAREEKTLMKLIVDVESRRILGCHLVGPGSAEMIQLVGIAIKMGATKEDFDRTCAVHPTAAEELVTLN